MSRPKVSSLWMWLFSAEGYLKSHQTCQASQYSTENGMRALPQYGKLRQSSAHVSKLAKIRNKQTLADISAKSTVHFKDTQLDWDSQRNPQTQLPRSPRRSMANSSLTSLNNTENTDAILFISSAFHPQFSWALHLPEAVPFQQHSSLQYRFIPLQGKHRP